MSGENRHHREPPSMIACSSQINSHFIIIESGRRELKERNEVEWGENAFMASIKN